MSYGSMATVPFMYIICGLLVGLAVTRYLEEYPSVKDLTSVPSESRCSLGRRALSLVVVRCSDEG